MKKIFICCMLFMGMTVFSQTPNPIDTSLSPNGVLENVFDQYGNSYKLSDIVVVDNSTQYLRATNPTPLHYGYFDLYLEDGCGLTTSDPDYANRKAVIERVLLDLTAFINSPLTASGKKVNIWVRNITNISGVPPTALGGASSFYNMPYNTTAGFGGIADNEIWKTIHTGKDSYTNVISPLVSSGLNAGTSGAFYHGMMAFNFSGAGLTWNTNLTATTAFPNDYDLYTVVLHEMIHALGFASLINSNGGTKFNAGYNYYSRFDQFLKNYADNQFLITNPGCNSMYDNTYNSPLGTAILQPTITPPQTYCGNTIRFKGISNVPVFTPGSFDNGNSLSHFEDLCVSPNVDNAYFVMADAIGKNIRKRYPKPEERNTLGNLGYSVNQSYGVNTVYYGIGSTLTPATYTGVVSGISVAGINDGINTNGTYKYIGEATVTNPIVINSLTNSSIRILSNDTGTASGSLPAGFECLQDVYDSSARFNGTLTTVTSVSNGNIDVTFNTTVTGLHLLRYVPVNGSQRGNITYIYVYVTGNCSIANSCDLISNGGFESSDNCGETIYNHGFPIPSINCWAPLCQTPDLYKRGCTLRTGVYAVNSNTNYNTSPVNTHNTPNDSFIGLYRSVGNTFLEGLQGQLSSQLIPNQNYQLSFWARVGNGTTTAGVSVPVNFSSIPNLMPAVSIGSLPFGTVVPASQSLTPTTLVPNDNQWHQYTYSFTFSGTISHNAIAVYTGTSTSSSYVYIDDVSLVPLNGGSFTLPATLCVTTQSIPDLNAYLNGIPTGGVFAGNTVNGNTLNTLFDMDPGIATISYTYTNSSGCSVTVYSNINVIAPIIPTISGSTSAYPTAPNNTTVNTTTIPAGYTAVWTITGGTGNITYGATGPTVGVTWSALPGYLTLTLTHTASGCSNSTTQTIYNLAACDCLNSMSFTYSRPGNNMASFQVVNGAGCSGVASGGYLGITWNYGDGHTGTIPSHTYSGTGPYTVTMTAHINGIWDNVICTGSSYSQSITLTCKNCDGRTNATESAIKIYPNPASTSLNFDISPKSAFPLEVVLRTIDGKELLREKWKLKKGEQVLQLELPNNISDGMIFVELVSDEIRETRTVLIKK